MSEGHIISEKFRHCVEIYAPSRLKQHGPKSWAVEVIENRDGILDFKTPASRVAIFTVGGKLGYISRLDTFGLLCMTRKEAVRSIC